MKPKADRERIEANRREKKRTNQQQQRRRRFVGDVGRACVHERNAELLTLGLDYYVGTYVSDGWRHYTVVLDCVYYIIFAETRLKQCFSMNTTT